MGFLEVAFKSIKRTLKKFAVVKSRLEMWAVHLCVHQGVLRLRTEVVVNSADDPIAISVPITGSLPPRSYVLDTGPEWALHFLQVRYYQAV